MIVQLDGRADISVLYAWTFSHSTRGRAFGDRVGHMGLAPPD